MAQESLGRMNPMSIGDSSSSINGYGLDAIFVSSFLPSDSYNRKYLAVVVLFAIIGLFTLMPTNDSAKNLLELIQTTSMTSTSLETIKTSNLVLVTDDSSGFDFVVSVADRKSSKKPSATGITDPLSLDMIDKDLIVDSFGGYSLVLNKFNTVEDHCLLITDGYVHQLSPLHQLDLDLWISLLETIDGVGFYNSNHISGASQAHKHMQLIPKASLKKFCKSAVRSQHVGNAPARSFPLEAAIATARETLHWGQYPFPKDNFKQGSDSDSIPQETTRSEPMIYQVPQFKFRHSLALLYSRKDFAAYQHDSSSENIIGSIISSSYGTYLMTVYEELLASQRLSPAMLQQCSTQLDPRASSTDSFADSSCMSDSAYNLVITPDYMLLAPRSALYTSIPTDSATDSVTVSINSFGYLGMVMVDSVHARDVVADRGPMGILDVVSIME